MVGTKAQKSGVTPNNFTNPVTYTVYAQDGTSQDYTVTVTIPHYLYVANTESTSISRCAVTSDGSLTSCANVGGTGVTGSTGIAINRTRTFAYITNVNNNTVSKCNLDDDGNLSGCAATATGASFSNLFGIALDGIEKYAYVTNNQPSAVKSVISSCKIQDNGDLSDCSDAITITDLIDSQTALAIVINKDANVVYFTTNHARLYTCNISNNGILSACAYIIPGGLLTGLAFDDATEKILYVGASYFGTSDPHGVLNFFVVNDGSLIFPPNSSNPFDDSLYNIALNKSASFLYIVNGNIVVQCEVLPAVVSNNCTPSGFPSEVANYSGLLFK